MPTRKPTTTKAKARASAGRTGRPPIAEPMAKRVLVRCTARDEAEFKAEVERLTKVTGQRWTVSGYLRVAGLNHLGKHLASIGES
jgi:hypothetical protein